VRRRYVAILAMLAMLPGTVVCASDASVTDGATPGYTQLILHMNATTTLTLDILTDAGSCTLVNSNSDFAAIDMGAANKTTQTNRCPGTGPTYAAGNTYDLTTNVSYKATCSGTCSTWKLEAALATTAATGVKWAVGGTNLTTTAKSITTRIAYTTTDTETFELEVKTNGASAATGALQQAIVFTASDTSTPTATATATLNAEEINEPGISIFFVKDASGVALAGGAFDADLDYGSVSEYGTPPAGVTIVNKNSTTYTAQTLFDIDVEIGGLTSSNYTLAANLASAAPTGLTYKLNGVTLATSGTPNITTTGSYGTDEAYTLQLVIVGNGVGFPTPNTPLSETLNVTATAN
jgi:hypothetical protein